MGVSTIQRETKLVRAAEGDADERFLRVASLGLDRAYRLAGLILGDGQDAEDATQDALLRAWHARRRLRDPAGFEAWFDRILVNVCHDRRRRSRRIRFVPLDDTPEPVLGRDPFRDLLDRDEALRALAVLDDNERVVVVLHYWADLTLAAIAERLGWPPGTVKSRLHRALLRMEAQSTASLSTERGRS